MDDMERIQSKIAFLERANNELSDVVYRQQQEIRALFTRFAELAERFEAATVEQPPLSTDAERPPHY